MCVQCHNAESIDGAVQKKENKIYEYGGNRINAAVMTNMDSEYNAVQYNT